MPPYKVLFVCTGNIYRSALAEVMFSHLLEKSGLRECIVCESAGTHSDRSGAPADQRAQLMASKHGLDLTKHAARQFEQADFANFDLILAMDNSHLNTLLARAPDDARDKIELFLSFAKHTDTLDVPLDSYYGENGKSEREWVIDMIEDGAQGLLEVLKPKFII